MLYISTSKRVLAHPFRWSKYTFQHVIATFNDFNDFFYIFLKKTDEIIKNQTKTFNFECFGFGLVGVIVITMPNHSKTKPF